MTTTINQWNEVTNITRAININNVTDKRWLSRPSPNPDVEIRAFLVMGRLGTCNHDSLCHVGTESRDIAQVTPVFVTVQ